MTEREYNKPWKNFLTIFLKYYQPSNLNPSQFSAYTDLELT